MVDQTSETANRYGADDGRASFTGFEGGILQVGSRYSVLLPVV